MQKYFIFFLLISLISCNQKVSHKLKNGVYRANLQITEKAILPFTFKVLTPNKLEIYNAKEVIKVSDVVYKDDSVYINMPVFTSYFVAKVSKNGLLKGVFVKKDLNRFIPFTTIKKTTRFDFSKKPTFNIQGNWETVFSPNSEKDRYIAKGVFKQNGNIVTGTFRTTTGDYRYLEGVIQGNELKLSTLDGAHAFLFTATVTNSKMNGIFYSGNHWSEPFIANRNDSFTLPNANSLTKIKEGAKEFHFSFPDETGKMIALTDKKFQNKVTIVQLFGTWCPNCLDESRYYSNFYKLHKSKDIEFVALAFEYVKTKEKAFEFIKKFKTDLHIEYPILLAQFGTTNKTKAQEKLPMLDKVRSYPTTIFLDKKGMVRKIHTGFNGPATGQAYLDYKKEFEMFIDELLTEK